VRLFLGTRKGSVNAGISDTLQDPQQRGNFWAYNNGITIICDAYQIENDKIVMNNFSIINGCQTTVSLASTSSVLDQVDVLTRLINAPQEVVDDIIRFNNSQNPIKMWDIASQNKTQRRLRREFEAL
jgi:AIPR protein